MQHLGVVLSPFGANGGRWGMEIAQARGGRPGAKNYLGPARPYPTTDRFFNTRGEVGYYYDTQLGQIPTDAELVNTYQCYTPVASGWIDAKEGYITGPWRFGWDPAGAYGPQTSLHGLRGLGADTPVQTAQDVIAVMNAYNAKLFKLTLISTAAVSLSALFTLWTRARRYRMEMKRKRK
jgi:hypothetical protein